MTGQHSGRRRQAALATIVLGLGGALAPMAPSSAATLGPCTVTQSGTTYTLTKDCNTSQTVVVPDGATLDGAGHTITAVDGTGGTPFVGQVIVGYDFNSNDTSTTPSHVRHLHVTSRVTATADRGFYGVGLLPGSSVRNVTVSHIYDAAGDFGAGVVIVPVGFQTPTSLPVSTVSHVTVTGYQNVGVANVLSDFKSDHLVVGPALKMQGQSPNTEGVSLLAEYGGTATLTQSRLANNNVSGGPAGSLTNIALLVQQVNKVDLSQTTIAGRTDDGDGIYVYPGGPTTSAGTDVNVRCSSITRPTSSVASASQTYGYGIDVASNNNLRTAPRRQLLKLPAGTSARMASAAAAATGTADVSLGGVKFAGWRRNVHNAANVTRVPTTCSTGSAVLRAHSYRVDDEHPIHFFGRILPGKVGTPVRIQLRTAHGWVTKKTTTQSRAGRFSAAVWMRDPAPGKGVDGPRYFRAVSAAGGKRVVSPTVKITLH